MKKLAAILALTCCMAFCLTASAKTKSVYKENPAYKMNPAALKAQKRQQKAINKQLKKQKKAQDKMFKQSQKKSTYHPWKK